MKMKTIALIFGLAFAMVSVAGAYAQDSTDMNKGKADTYAKDVESQDSIIAALYDSISGGPGVQRDWDRFKNLFIEGARLIPTGKDQASGLHKAGVFTPEDYVKRSEPFMLKNGFFEKEVARKSVRFGNIVHIFSTYEGRNKESDEKPFLRGINSIQLLFDGNRWWVVTVYWQAETPDNPLPAEFLP